MDLIEKARRCREFIDALDEEHRKIQLFQRELPLCLRLLNQTIDSYKRMVDAVAPPADEPVLKAFICSRDAATINVSDLENHSFVYQEIVDRKDDEIVSLEPSAISIFQEEHNNMPDETPEKRQDWMASTRIWSSQEMDPVPMSDSPQKPIAVKSKKYCGVDEAEHLDKKKDADAAVTAEEALDNSNDCNTSGEDEENCGSGREDRQKKDNSSNSNKPKTRRLWSEELHKRFVHAIRQLGGYHAATPKQIRQLMKVDGLTNDEIKSHLQKFRIHARRSSSTTRSINSSNAQTAHFVLVGGIWIPPHDHYAAAQPGAAAAITATYPSGSSSASGMDIYSNCFLSIQVDQPRSEQSDEGHAN